MFPFPFSQPLARPPTGSFSPPSFFKPRLAFNMRFTTFLLASALLAALGTAKGVLASPDDPNPLQAREISPLMTKYAIAFSVSSPVLTSCRSQRRTLRKGAAARGTPPKTRQSQYVQALGRHLKALLIILLIQLDLPSGLELPAVQPPPCCKSSEGPTRRFCAEPRAFSLHQEPSSSLLPRTRRPSTTFGTPWTPRACE